MTKTLVLKAKSGRSGILHLKMPTQLANCNYKVTIRIEDIADETKLKKSRLLMLSGRLNWRGNALAVQRKLRNEW